MLKSWQPKRKHQLQRPNTTRAQETTSQQQQRYELSVGSNDSSSATLTSIVTIAKYHQHSPSGSATLSAHSLQKPQQAVQHSSVQSLTTICGSNGSGVMTTTTTATSAPNSGRIKRSSKFSPLAAEAFNCDPLLFAAQEKRSTEIIL